MASGMIYGSTANYLIQAKIQWMSQPVEGACASAVTARLYLRRTNTDYTGTATGGSNCMGLELDGQTVAPTGAFLMVPNGGAWVLACEGTVTVSHGSDGAKALTIKAFGQLQGTSVSAIACEGTATLDRLTTNGTILSVRSETGYLDGALTVAWSSGIGAACHRLQLWDGDSLLWEEAPAHSSPFTLTPTQLAEIYARHIHTDQVTLIVKLDTFAKPDCGEKVGATDQRELALRIPRNADTLPEVSLIHRPFGLEGLYTADGVYILGLYIQGKTGVRAQITAAGKHGAQIQSAQLVAEGVTYAAIDGSVETEALNTAGKVTLRAVVTDSRGFQAVAEAPVVVAPYSPPQLTVAACCRCGEDGTAAEDGCFLRLDANLTHTCFPGYTEDDNPCRLLLQIKPVEEAAYGAEHLLLCGREMEQSSYFYGGLVRPIREDGTEADLSLEEGKSYHVRILVRDLLGGEATTAFLVPTAAVQCHEGDGFLALGKYANGPGVDIAAHWPVRIRGELYLGDDNTTLADYIRKIINGG